MPLTTQGVKILPNTYLHWIALEDIPALQQDFYGCCYVVGRHTTKSTPRWFHLEIDGQLATKRQHKEIDLLVTLGGIVERRCLRGRATIATLHLPRSHGYSGEQYGLNRTRLLFPDAGVRAAKTA